MSIRRTTADIHTYFQNHTIKKMTAIVRATVMSTFSHGNSASCGGGGGRVVGGAIRGRHRVVGMTSSGGIDIGGSGGGGNGGDGSSIGGWVIGGGGLIGGCSIGGGSGMVGGGVGSISSG